MLLFLLGCFACCLSGWLFGYKHIYTMCVIVLYMMLLLRLVFCEKISYADLA